MGHREDVMFDQLMRFRKYPPDRIPFLDTERASVEDQKNFRLYTDGIINLPTLCMRVKEANLLPHVSEDAMLNELKITRWLVDEDNARYY